METRDKTGLDSLWPGVQTEIRAARRRAAAGRRAVQGGVIVAALGLAFLGLRTDLRGLGGTGSALVAQVWTVEGVAARSGLSHEYPLVQGSRVFVVQGQGAGQHVAGLSRDTGRAVWASAETFEHCRLAADDLGVYVLAMSRASGWRLFALEPGTGRTLWRRESLALPVDVPSLLTAFEGGVCWSQGRAVICCSPATGLETWRRAWPPGPPLSSPCARGGAVYVASPDTLYAIDPASGSVAWQCGEDREPPLKWGPRPLLTAEGRRVYVASGAPRGAGAVRCVSADSRGMLWSRPLSETPLRLQFAGDRLLVRGQSLLAFDGATGDPLWALPIGGCGPVSATADRVYLVDAQDRARLIAVDRRSGREVWHRQLAASCNGIVLDGGTGFLSGNDGSLRAMRLKDAPPARAAAAAGTPRPSA